MNIEGHILVKNDSLLLEAKEMWSIWEISVLYFLRRV